MVILASIFTVGAYTIAGAAIGGFGTPAVCAKFKKQPTEGLEAIPQFILGGIAGGLIGFGGSIYSVAQPDDATLPTVERIIELNSEDLPACESNRYVVDNDGNVIGCAFD